MEKDVAVTYIRQLIIVVSIMRLHKHMRCLPSRPLEKAPFLLGALVIGPVALNDSLVFEIFFWHCGRGVAQPLELLEQLWRRRAHEPPKMLFTRVTLGGLEAKGVLVYEAQGHATEPHVVGQRGRSP